MLVNGIDASNLTKGNLVMSKRKSPEASGKKAGAVKQVPKEFRLSNEQTTKAADLAKAINANFDNGDDEQAKAAMRLLEVRKMFPEGRPGNALFEAWCSEHISQSFKTVANLLSHARKGDKAAVLASINAAREAAKARWQTTQARSKTADQLKADTNRPKPDCVKALKESDDDPALAKEWLKANPATIEPEEEQTPGFEGICRPLRNALKSAPDKLADLAAHLVTGLDRKISDDLATAIMEAAAALEEEEEKSIKTPWKSDQSENSGGELCDLKPETETEDGTAIPHDFKVKPGQSGAGAAREKAAAA